MCGIVGVAALHSASLPDKKILEQMVHTLHHRGPDEQGLDCAGGVALGATRLAIIDLPGGSQPMSDQEGTVRVVFNGEIYNYRSLRRELIGRGHQFRSEADGEVLVHGYKEWGDSLLDRLNGMFGFAIHDRRQNRILLARDRAGVKPLYYAFLEDYFIWGSELKALLAFPHLKREFHAEAAMEFLTWEYVPDDRTLFKGVHRLPPATSLSLDLNQNKMYRQSYWTPPTEDRGVSGTSWMKRLDSALANSVQEQLMSDVPLGAFLSGGVDSSLILSYAGAVQAFHVSFADASYSETRYARRIAEHLGVQLHCETLDADVRSDFFTLLETMDDPIADSSMFSTYLLCKSTRRQVKVAISGDGGDELFGGYETYLAERLYRLYALLPAPLRRAVVEPLVDTLKPQAVKKGLINRLKRFVEGAREPERLKHTRWRRFLTRQLASRLINPEVLNGLQDTTERHIAELFESASARDPLNQMLWVDARSYLAENCLAKVDKSSMICSLEVRVPMLDREVMELAFRMPQEWKIRWLRQKVLLKRLACKHLPTDCVHRPKEGFSVPLKHYLRAELRDLLEESTAPERVRDLGLVNRREVERLKTEHLGGKANHSHILWSIILLHQWHKRWFKGTYS